MFFFVVVVVEFSGLKKTSRNDSMQSVCEILSRMKALWTRERDFRAWPMGGAQSAVGE